ncbi:MAG: methyltransferase [Bacteroidales bacterium]|nr:methyltransferase [Bacteroidales bacterium]
MKKLPEVNVSFKELYGMLIAPTKAKLLWTGIELKVFNHLSEPKTAKDVAEKIGTHSVNTELFLEGLAACDLLEKKNGLYRNTPVTQEFLVEESPTYLGLVFADQFQKDYQVLNDLPRLVKKGPPTTLPETDMNSAEMCLKFTHSHASSERAGIAQQVAKIISGLPEFPSFGKMLDLGGGPGLIGIGAVAAHPNMNGVIFDRPAIVKVAETFIREYGMEDRVEVLGGDYKYDSIGNGYDLVLANDNLYYGKNDTDSIVKKIYEALNPAGVFISFHGGLTHERTKPDTMVLGMILDGLMGQGMLVDQGFIADSMLRVGFRSVRSCTLNTDWGPMDLDIGRKM